MKKLRLNIEYFLIRWLTLSYLTLLAAIIWYCMDVGILHNPMGMWLSVLLGYSLSSVVFCWVVFFIFDCIWPINRK